MGLTSMRQRAQALQGSLRVNSGDHGTTVMATLPLNGGWP
jgi:signal transduction histidine kinase